MLSKTRYYVDVKTVKLNYHAIFESHLMFYWFGHNIHHPLKDYILYRKNRANVFFKIEMLTQVLKSSKFLKFRDKVALENCILITNLHESLPKILFDRFTLSFEFHTHNTRWENNGRG